MPASELGSWPTPPPTMAFRPPCRIQHFARDTVWQNRSVQASRRRWISGGLVVWTDVRILQCDIRGSSALRITHLRKDPCEDLASDLVGILTPVESEHMAAIVEPLKIGALLRSMHSYHGDPVVRLALRLVPVLSRK